jgi:sulfur relay (sulfurtransferase) DsrC/TusE family protein
MFAIRILSIGILLGFLTACQRVQNAAYNFAEAPFATLRIETLLKDHQVAFEELHCQMMNTTRNFGCTFKTKDNALETRWVKALKLEQSNAENTKNRYLHTLYPQNCEKNAPFDQNLDQAQFLLFENKDRDFKAVQGIEYMVLYIDTQTHQACVQAAHSLG